MEQEGILRLSVDVTNTSGMDGDEIVEFYARYEGKAFEKPHHKLIGFVRVHVPAAGNSADAGTVCAVCEILLKELESVQEDGSSVLLDGSYTLFAGTCQPDERSIALTQSVPLALHVEAAGGKLKCAAQDGAAEMPDTKCFRNVNPISTRIRQITRQKYKSVRGMESPHHSRNCMRIRRRGEY